MTQGELEKIPAKFEKIMRQLEIRIMEDRLAKMQKALKKGLKEAMSPVLKKAYEAFCRHNGSFTFEDFYRIAGYNDRADGLANEFIRRQRDVDVKAP